MGYSAFDGPGQKHPPSFDPSFTSPALSGAPAGTDVAVRESASKMKRALRIGSGPYDAANPIEVCSTSGKDYCANICIALNAFGLR